MREEKEERGGDDGLRGWWWQRKSWLHKERAVTLEGESRVYIVSWIIRFVFQGFCKEEESCRVLHEGGDYQWLGDIFKVNFLKYFFKNLWSLFEQVFHYRRGRWRRQRGRGWPPWPGGGRGTRPGGRRGWGLGKWKGVVAKHKQILKRNLILTSYILM